MTAHSAVSLVMDEQYGKIGVWRARRHNDCTVLVGMAPRLKHERSAKMVIVDLHECSTFENRLAFHHWQAGQDDTQRLPAGVCIENGNLLPVSGGIPRGYMVQRPVNRGHSSSHNGLLHLFWYGSMPIPGSICHKKKGGR